jgi:hypothetical protein
MLQYTRYFLSMLSTFSDTQYHIHDFFALLLCFLHCYLLLVDHGLTVYSNSC